MEKKRVVVIKDVFREDSKIKEFSGYHAIAYAGIQTFYHPMMQANVLTLQTLYFVMGIKNARTQKNIKDAIMDLIKWGLIKINQDEFNNNTPLIIVIPKVDTTDSKFATINKQFVWDILISEYSVQEKGNMLLVYMVLAQYMGNKHSAFPSMDKIGENTLLTKPTIKSAINNLVDMDMLYYGNYGYKIDKSNQVKRHNNIYIFRDIPNADLLYKKISKEIKEHELENKDK